MKSHEKYLRQLIRETVLLEARDKAFRRVMRQVFFNLPDFVFNDMYGHEKQWGIKTDADLGEDVERFVAAINAARSEEERRQAVNAMRQYLRGLEYEWLDTKWSSKKPKVTDIRWSDLSEKKRNFFKQKYSGLNRNFPATTEAGHGYWDKVVRLLKTSLTNEPVIILQADEGLDIIGGNNRVFNAFLMRAIKGMGLIEELENLVKVQQTESSLKPIFEKIFQYLEDEDPSVSINAYIGRRERVDM